MIRSAVNILPARAILATIQRTFEHLHPTLTCFVAPALNAPPQDWTVVAVEHVAAPNPALGSHLLVALIGSPQPT